MKELVLICPCSELSLVGERLRLILDYALNCGLRVSIITRAENLRPLQGKRLLFAIDLGSDGINLEYCRMLSKIRQNTDFFLDCVGAVVVDGSSECYTKAVGRELVFAANMAGCAFPGRPLVEGTGTLRNFQIQADRRKTDLMTAYHLAARNLIERLTNFIFPQPENPKLLVLHASNFLTSNTWNFWNMVKKQLHGIEIQELSLRNGEIFDCGGCPYTMCMHFSEKGKCYYGGTMTEKVHPAVLECNALLLLCPNYNDAVSANIAAFINRLTSLYRKTPFYEKYLFSVIVSGYSGGDLVAEQLISGLNMNKSFLLPPRFAHLETANDPGSIRDIPDIEKTAEAYASHIEKVLGKD